MTGMAARGAFARCRLPAIVRRVDDAWVAECVPLDVMTQGDSLEHALDMLVDAIDLVIDDDLERGVDALRARRPSDRSMSQLSRLMAAPLEPVDVKNVDVSVSVVLALVDVVRPVVPAMALSRSPQLRYVPLGAPRACLEPAVV